VNKHGGKRITCATAATPSAWGKMARPATAYPTMAAMSAQQQKTPARRHHLHGAVGEPAQ